MVEEAICRYCGAPIVELPNIDGCLMWLHKIDLHANDCKVMSPKPVEFGIAVVKNEREMI